MSATAHALRPAVEPAAAIGRVMARTRPGSRASSAIDGTLRRLDVSGRRGRARVEGSVLDAADQAFDRAVARLIQAGLVERVTAELIASRVLDHVAEQVIDSSFYEDVVDRVLESEELWRIVDEIARSPEVLAAISAGSAGLANEMAGQVRRRTIVADDIAERIARRLLRRGPRPPEGGSSLPSAAED
jgi:hypothetical protein